MGKMDGGEAGAAAAVVMVGGTNGPKTQLAADTQGQRERERRKRGWGCEDGKNRVGGGLQERCLVITADDGRGEGPGVIFLSCLLHLFAHRNKHTRTHAHTHNAHNNTNKHTDKARRCACR